MSLAILSSMRLVIRAARTARHCCDGDAAAMLPRQGRAGLRDELPQSGIPVLCTMQKAFILFQLPSLTPTPALSFLILVFASASDDSLGLHPGPRGSGIAAGSVGVSVPGASALPLPFVSSH